MLFPSLIVSLGLLASSVSARAFNGPRATAQADAGDLVFVPEPTTAPKVAMDLFRRNTVVTDLIAPDNTCGYVSGRAGAAYTCNAYTDLCAFFPGTSTTAGFLGCCNPANYDCGLRVTCINSYQYYVSSICDNGCAKDTYTLKCTASTAPYCNGIRFPNEGVEDFFCDDTSVSTWQTAYTTYSGEKDGRVFSPLVVTLTSGGQTSGSAGVPLSFTTPASPQSPKSSSSNAAGSQNTNGGQTTSSSNGATTNSNTVVPPSPSTSSSSSGAPIGGIVGGVVGGIGGLALIGLGIFFFLRRGKKTDAGANNTAPPPNYAPPLDPNNPAFAAANTGKPGLTTQETAMVGQYAAPQIQEQQQQYQPPAQYPPPGQEYQPQMPDPQYPAPVQSYPSQTQEQQYQPQIQDQQYQTQAPQQYLPQTQEQQYQPQMQQYPSQVQQQPYPNVAEVPGSYSQSEQQNTTYHSQGSSQAHYSMVSSAGQPSPNPQSLLNSGFLDRNDTTSPVSSELGGPQVPNSPAPTFVSNVISPGPGPGAPGVEGRVEMSANMTGRPFPVNAYEVPGSEVPR